MQPAVRPGALPFEQQDGLVRSGSQLEVARSLRMHAMLAALVGVGVLSLLLLSLWLESLWHLQHTHSPLFLSLALPASLASALFAAVLAHQLDPRVYLASDVARVLGLPPSATLFARTGVSEEMRDESILRLAAAVETLHRRAGARTFSFVPVSVEMDIGPLVRSLQRKLEHLGFQVRVAATADIFPAPGDPYRASRPLQHIAGEPLESSVMEALKQAKSNFDFVLLTLAPLLASAQTEYLAASTDATILVAACNLTREDELAHAFESLRALHVVSISVVLDEVEVRFADRMLRRSIAAFNQQQATRLRSSSRSLPSPLFSLQREVEPAPISAEPAAFSPPAANSERPAELARTQAASATRSPLHARETPAAWEHLDLGAARDHSPAASPAASPATSFATPAVASRSPLAQGSSVRSPQAALPPEETIPPGTSESGGSPERLGREEEHPNPAPAAFTTARWPPIPTLRPASLPWRERASSASSMHNKTPSSELSPRAIHSANDQALDSVVPRGRGKLLEDVVERTTPSHAEEPRRAGSRPEPLATEPDATSRRWGLLSRIARSKPLASPEPQGASEEQSYSQESHNPKTKNS